MEKEKKTTTKRKKKTAEVEVVMKEEPQETPPIKKSGRKPKGGKIMETIDVKSGNDVLLPNIIIHLKCSLKDLEEKNNEIKSFNNNESMFEIIEKNYINNKVNCNNKNISNNDS